MRQWILTVVVFLYVLPAAAAQSNDSTPSKFSLTERTLVLKKHNDERKLAGKLPLTWNDRLASYAQGYANKLAASGGFEHEDSNTLRKLNHGENLHATTSSDRALEVKRSVDDWADEKFENGRNIYVPGLTYSQYKTKYPEKMFGHWTQMIWGNTKQLGMGIAKIQAGPRKGGYVVVARYFPTGNYINQAP